MNKEKHTVGFIGLGYAGFPMACLFSSKYKVVGFDISESRISELKSGVDHCGDVPEDNLKTMLDNGTVFTNDINDLKNCDFYIVTVPTPVDNSYNPDISYIESASKLVGTVLKKGDVVIFESTVFPGATEEVCVPLLEQTSGLTCNKDFYVGYSPERINPGDKEHTPVNVVKVTSGSTPEAAEKIKDLYAEVLGNENVYSASSIKVAEACKVVENAQRDINIAFINEVAKILNSLDIETNEVVDAMNTKWNALNFRPGLVGGHCIGIDPYYLLDKANKMGIEPKLIHTGRKINNSMSDFIAHKIIDNLKDRKNGDAADSKILLLGFSFKENCPDIRNTKVFDLYNFLKKSTENIEIYDPIVDKNEVKKTYGIEIESELEKIKDKKFDAVVICAPHDNFLDFDFGSVLEPKGFLYDFKGFTSRLNLDKNIETIIL